MKDPRQMLHDVSPSALGAIGGLLLRSRLEYWWLWSAQPHFEDA